MNDGLGWLGSSASEPPAEAAKSVRLIEREAVWPLGASFGRPQPPRFARRALRDHSLNFRELSFSAVGKSLGISWVTLPVAAHSDPR
jgi:hypothetical protein